MNGIIINDKVYEAIPEQKESRCDGCCFDDPYTERCPCGYACVSMCDSIFRFSQTLTDKLNEK